MPKLCGAVPANGADRVAMTPYIRAIISCGSAFDGGRFRANDMAQTQSVVISRRRDVLLCAAAGLAVLAVLGRSSGALAQAANPVHAAPDAGTWEAALKKIIGDAKPIDGQITFDVAEVAENGNMVPFTLTAESPMTAADHIKALHLLATGNPQPGIASFKFSPASGRATVSSRLRLARTQDLIAVAERSDGKFVLARRTVKVTIGGCGG
jgi:sulfur-oxidizing protein SoxY